MKRWKGLLIIILVGSIAFSINVSATEPNSIWEALGGMIYILPQQGITPDAEWISFGGQIYVYNYTGIPEAVWQSFGAQINITLLYPPWDLNQDGVVDYLDASILVNDYGKSGPAGWIMADIDDNGIVNYLDASILVTHYGESYL